MSIFVTKTHLPDRKRLDKYLDGIYARNWVTNRGELVLELTARLEEYLGVENLLLVSNGTLGLQVALKALGISGGVVTSPFSFVATTSALVWDNLEPQFADINPGSFCLDPANIEAVMTATTTAFVPVHVFGNACDVEGIADIASKHGNRVIYDAAHCFGTRYHDNSLLKYGDAAMLSFHATKLFHTLEGGAVVFRSRDDLEHAESMINFGITGYDTIAGLGINAKMTEVQAAVGLCLLDDMDQILQHRSALWHQYEAGLSEYFQMQHWTAGCSNNYSYFPLLFETEQLLLQAREDLARQEIFPRRYFYPSLDTLPYVSASSACPVSRDISSRVLCLPLYADLPATAVTNIIESLKPYRTP